MFDRLKKSLSSFAEKVSKTELDEDKLEAILSDFKISLVESDVALSVAEDLCESLKKGLIGVKVGRLEEKGGIVKGALKESLLATLKAGGEINLVRMAEGARVEKRPLTLLFVGINGSGKTTTIAKVARLLGEGGFSTVLAGSDTYRAGAIEQLEEHSKRLGLKLISRGYGSDPTSVAFDAIAYAKARGVNAVLIDTSGRMETNRNLMEEMRKIFRVTTPDAVIFVGDALTGNDAVLQAQEFNSYVPITTSILTKADADVKGGSAISIAHITRKPIAYLGVGQRYEDLAPFQPEKFTDQVLEKI